VYECVCVSVTHERMERENVKSKLSVDNLFCSHSLFFMGVVLCCKLQAQHNLL